MSSDGLRHEAEMQAPSKDDVYAALRQRGIRAIKVTERIQPIVKSGFGGLRKRDWAVIALAALVLVAAVVFYVFSSGAGLSARRSYPTSVREGRSARDGALESEVVEIKLGDRIASARPRRQLSATQKDIDEAFVNASERFLARFAEPGAQCPKIADDELKAVEEDLFETLDADIVIYADDSRVKAEIKGVVAGIKDEVRMLVGTGRGFREVVGWLQQRQLMESDYRARLIKRYANDEAEANRQLRNLGMAEIGPVDGR
jgi:hypothetical protein